MHMHPLTFSYKKNNKIVYYFLKNDFYCLPFYCCDAIEVLRDYKPSTGNGIPRKCLRVLGASCLGQGLGGSAPSCSQACPVLVEPGAFRSSSWQDTGGIWQRPPAAARKTSRCRSFLLLSAFSSCLGCVGLHAFPNAPPRVSPLSGSKQPSEISRKGTVFPI